VVSHSLGALERHRHRRSTGIPTVSVLLGDADVWAWIWCRWQQRHQIPTLELAEPSLDGALASWLAAAPVATRFRQRVLESAAARLGCSVPELEARIHSTAQLEAFARELARAADIDASLVQSALLRDAPSLPQLALDGFPRALTSIAAVLGEPLPALFMRAPSDAAAGWLSLASATLLTLARALPRLELALFVDESQFTHWRRGAPAGAGRRCGRAARGRAAARARSSWSVPQSSRGLRRRQRGRARRCRQLR
jgi:hypothetical protein